MHAAEIRARFLDFFASKGHTVVRSSPLIPGNDPTLLFTNAGMVQFKDVFTGRDARPYTRAVSVQRCVRAGGKHNDLENVGYTARHHTFFEMLGNFSFGDYFKREAIHYAWELLTDVYRLPPEKLWVTVYHEDDEAYAIWQQQIGVPATRIVRIGDHKGARYSSDNFWQMAETGPCGPCSEIFYDHGPHVPGGPPGSPDADGDRYIEIWNLVFMQYNRSADGALTPLPKPCVDTGMGLERIAAVLQHVQSSYDIDLFQALIRAATRATGMTAAPPRKPLEHFSVRLPLARARRQYGDRCGRSRSPSRSDGGDPAAIPNTQNGEATQGKPMKNALETALKVIADHIRACAFLITDGVIPSNEGRGYVLRRIIRRAIRHGYQLGCKTPFFHALVVDLAREMGSAYPELAAAQRRTTDILHQEEARFFETIASGMAMLEAELSSIAPRVHARSDMVSPLLSGELAFKLHDTYGFPLDLTADICRARGVGVHEAAFNAAMARQKERARSAGKFNPEQGKIEYRGGKTAFTGYESLRADASKIVALYAEGEAVERLYAGQRGVVVLDTTPFYAESGGQVGDQGMLSARDARFAVTGTFKIQANAAGHHGTLEYGELSVGDAVRAEVEQARRARTMRNHSATHLMHHALREVLGAHVQQKGSRVDADKTRFDFSHSAPLNRAQIQRVEALVNAEILRNAPTKARTMPYDEAIRSGAVALFGEKYGDSVRVLDIGFSRELCGGTHVARTGDIGLFRIVSESGVAAGIRRIEAVTGEAALRHVQMLETQLLAAAGALKTMPEALCARIEQLQQQLKTLEKERTQWQAAQAARQRDALAAQVVEIGGVQVLAAQVDNADARALRAAVDALKDQLKHAVVVLASVHDGKVNLIGGVTSPCNQTIHAGELVNFVAQRIGGKGGGRADLAQAGGTQPAQLSSALHTVKAWVENQLNLTERYSPAK
ncbi:Alanyl-tRNA synthetase (Alanine--tRNA ligase) (AlaRS) [Candidatus Glomeribacter gigasporarum BEG34]|uniref:Alanine--tRNA ligase n=1 Tax=Candidatus Glomeribacter gigasporarum BEG34 TaxID=1070319 RepID=G2JAH4_9BURK|nr:alanine--tRNA ligase [Candidatus Glomeribacter gigasporarum]CCD29776.1 Alanyl-tRNA synthetase (Alanine--tRNA ligase) (AlaRS) [Candidatus Glomeribacter gigasporarum BEG34]